MAGKFISFLPTHSGSTIKCDVVPAGLVDAIRWDALVQPLISRSQNFSADQTWNWPKIVRRTDLGERLLGRRSVYFQLTTTTTKNERIPLGQILVSEGYPFLMDLDRKSVYLWFLAAAPLPFLTQFGIPKLKIMRAMVDTAVQFSLMNGFEGRVCLHAAPTPNDPVYHADLFSKYVGIGLTPIPSSRQIMVKANDGRYFYCDEQSWTGVSSPLNHLR